MSAHGDAHAFLGQLLDELAHGQITDEAADRLALEFVGFCDEWAGVHLWAALSDRFPNSYQ